MGIAASSKHPLFYRFQAKEQLPKDLPIIR